MVHRHAGNAERTILSAAQETGKGHSRQAMTGVMWAYISFFGEKLIVFGTTAVIARFLVPDEFAVIAAALLVLALGDALRDFGLKDALIYIGEDEGHADSMFWLNLGIGAALSAFIFAIAPIAARGLNSPELTDVLRWMSPVFLVNALGGAHEALLQRRFLFLRRYVVDFISAVVKGVLSIALVMAGYAVWAVVYAFLAGAIVRTIGRWLSLSWRPGFRLEWQHARSLLGYGASVVVVCLIDMPLLMAEQIAITVMLGQTALAYYYIAARIPEAALSHFNLVAARVVFPIFASMKEDREQLVAYIHETARFTSFAILPMSIGLAAVADLVIPVIFGEYWQPSIVLLVVLSFSALAEAITWSIGDGFKAMGRPDLLARLTVLDILYVPPLVFAGIFITGEAVGACIGHLIGYTISNVIRLFVARAVLGITIPRYLACFRSAGIATAVMVAAVLLTKAALHGYWPIVELISAIAAGALVYGTVLWSLERERILHVARIAGLIADARRPISGGAPSPASRADRVRSSFRV